MRTQLTLAIAMSALVACSSYETTYFSRDDGGNLTTKTVPGVPIVVTVPQKLGFLATESVYEITTFSDRNGTLVPSTRRTTETSVDRNPISLGESKLANLDIKRPLFGTAKTSMKLENQYPSELSSEVDDKTLGRVLDTLDKFVQKQGTIEPGAGGATKTLISQRTFLLIYDPQTGGIHRQRL